MKLHLRWLWSLLFIGYVSGMTLTWSGIDDKPIIDIALGMVMTLTPGAVAICAYRYGLLKGIFRGPTRPDDHESVINALARDERTRASLVTKTRYQREV